MNRNMTRWVACLGLIALGACDLDVSNPNQPETERVLATPSDVESLLGNYYRRWHAGLYGSTGNVGLMAAVQSFENYSTLSNNCMGQRVGIPRAGNDNSIGNLCGPEQARVYFFSSEVTRVASSILTTLAKDGFTLGSPSQDARAKSFGEFLRGLSLGYLALVYDSAGIVAPGMSAEDPGELRDYVEVMDSALVALDRSIAYATDNGGWGAMTLPSTWIPSSTTFTSAEFIKLAKSYRARFRANNARTPAERAGVEWAKVIADAQGGITADHDNITSSTAGPFNDIVDILHTFTTWHQMTPMIMGMGDVSGSYAAFIGTPLADRGKTGGFFMVTPDLRFPQGATRTAQQDDFQAKASCGTASTPCERYLQNRLSGGDLFSGDGWGWSNYDFVRFFSWRTSGDGTARNGKLVFFTKSELNLLEAEGHLRTGAFAAAAALINKSRTAGMSTTTPSYALGGGLPPITVLDATSPVPGGADCVPKVPVSPNFNTVACGTMMEALKWEKRIETLQTHFMAWFLDSRGWGDLATGTGLHWPVPYQDLQARGRTGAAIYSTGGANPDAAPRSTYGW